MSKVAVVYWSGTGHTESMANAVVEGAKEAGAEVDLIFSDDFNEGKLADYSGIAFGCPAMGSEQLEEFSFEPMFAEVEKQLSGKKVALFGSYEWNDGQWMIDWTERCEDDAINLVCPAVTAYGEPDDEALGKLKDLGKAIV